MNIRIIITVYFRKKVNFVCISAAILATQVEWERVFGVVGTLKAAVYMKKMMIIFSFCVCGLLFLKLKH